MLAKVRKIGGRETALAVVTLASALIFSALSGNFATSANLLAVSKNCVELLIVGLGLTFVIAMGGIDISVGAVMGIVAIAIGKMLLAGFDPAVAAVVGPLLGGAIGFVTASTVVACRIPAIVGTIALLGVYRTVIYVLLGGQWLSGLPTGLTALISIPLPGGIPIYLVLIVALYGVAFVVLRWTPFGLHLLATGFSAEKARLSGVAVYRTQFLVYLFSGVMAGLAAVYYVGTYRNVEMSIGGTLALDAIVAVILGGTAVQGGRASLLGTVIGALLIRVLQNGFTLIGIPSLWQPVVTGALLIGTLCLDQVGAIFWSRHAMPMQSRKAA